MTEAKKTEYDAIVIGGGPSGSSYAITMATAGYSVLQIERDVFPRFHIGESLLPYTADVLEQLGVLERVGAGDFPIKLGLELCSSDGFLRRVPLGEIGDGFRNWTYQVERAEFDHILLQSSADAGAEVLQPAKVTGLLSDGERVAGVRYAADGQEYEARARYVVDASGRAGVVARALKLRQSDANLKMAAVFKHFGNLDEGNNPGSEGDTQIGVHPDGWIWAIPIRKDVISVGAMAPAALLRSAERPSELFDEHVRRLPRIAERIRGTEVVRDLTGENNFEYHADTLAGSGYFIIGDAGCFSDPIFSAGVYLALATGRRAAQETMNILTEQEPEDDVLARYQRFFKTGYETYYRLIRAVYDDRAPVMGQFIQQMLMDAGIDEKWRVRTLNGDFWSETNPFVNRLKQERWDLFQPYEPLYGCPVYGRK